MMMQALVCILKELKVHILLIFLQNHKEQSETLFVSQIYEPAFSCFSRFWGQIRSKVLGLLILSGSGSLLSLGWICVGMFRTVRPSLLIYEWAALYILSSPSSILSLLSSYSTSSILLLYLFLPPALPLLSSYFNSFNLCLHLIYNLISSSPYILFSLYPLLYPRSMLDFLYLTSAPI